MFKTERISAFSDGVIAIAITLLVLNLEIPSVHDVPASGLLSYLRESTHSVLGYLSSFVLIGTYWLMHYFLFHFIARADRTLVCLNGLFLLIVSFMPFPTGLQAAYREDELAMALYCGTQVLCGLSLLALWSYATRSGLIVKGLPPQDIPGISRQLLFAPAISAVALVVSFIDITLSRITLLAIPIIYFTYRAYDRSWITGPEEQP